MRQVTGRLRRRFRLGHRVQLARMLSMVAEVARREADKAGAWLPERLGSICGELSRLSAFWALAPLGFLL